MIETFRAYQSVLRLPGISRLLLAACLSRLAGRMFMLAIVLYALDRLRAPSMAGWVAFASMAPGLVISPIAGAWLDRVGAAKAIVMDMMASAVLLLGLVIADVSGAGTTPLLFAIVTTYGLAKPFGNAGVRTMIPHLSPSEMLDRANALDTTIYAVVDILGPACAGVLYGFAGGLVTLTAIAVLFALAGLAVRTLLHLSHTVQSSQASLLSEALAGVKYVLANRSLRGIAVAYSLYQVSWGALLVIVPVIVQGSYGRGPTADTVVGALWTGAGIAGAVGAAAGDARRAPSRPVH